MRPGLARPPKRRSGAKAIKVSLRPNDVFAFTAAAAGNYFTDLTRDFAAHVKREFKHVKKVSEHRSEAAGEEGDKLGKAGLGPLRAEGHRDL
jgi:hypothetical protein